MVRVTKESIAEAKIGLWISYLNKSSQRMNCSTVK